MASDSSIFATTLIIALFFMWGIANNLNDILIQQFSIAFDLSDMSAGFVQSAFYTGYFFGALPAASFVRSYGYKAAVIFGLSFYSCGAVLFYPFSLNGGWYLGFLGSLYLLAIGLAFLETSANVWVVLLGDLTREGFGTQALNIAQSFNPLGCLAGVIIGQFCILTGEPENPVETLSPLELDAFRAYEAARVGLPYLTLGLIVAFMTIVIALTTFPAVSSKNPDQLVSARLLPSINRLLNKPGFFFGVVAQFFYIGAQVSVWSYTIRFVQEADANFSDRQAATFLTIGLFLFMAGRFVASSLLTYIESNDLLAMYAALAGASCATAAIVGGKASIVALCAISFFMSMMYPTIFGLSISKVASEDVPIGGSMLVMAIVGGAVLTPLMGAVSDGTSIATAYLVPACCFLVVAAFAISTRNHLEKEPLVSASPTTSYSMDAA